MASTLALGFSSNKLSYLTNHLDHYVEGARLPCAACLIHRHGQEAYFHATGMSDVARKKDLKRDAIFRIYSMSKPVTSVALMMLYEMGRFQLDDPVSKHLPNWSDIEVYVSGKGKSMESRKPSSEPTIKHLLTHTSGLTYGFMEAHHVDALYRKMKIATSRDQTLEEMSEALPQIPLLFDPGERWNYSVATDVCGFLVERFSGQPLDEFIASEMLKPLGMRDSGFHVNSKARERFTACYSITKKGYHLEDDAKNSPYFRRPAFLSGGGGMVATIDDYARFAQMLLNGGELNGNRLLGRKTVEFMAINHLPGGVDLASMGQQALSETPLAGVGYGLGFSVVMDPATESVLDSFGSFGSGGAAGTFFWVDPMEDLTVVFMTQLFTSSAVPIGRELKTLVYQALID